MNDDDEDNEKRLIAVLAGLFFVGTISVLFWLACWYLLSDS